MAGALAILLSCSLGYFVVRCLRPRDTVFGLSDIFLVLGLGAGISTQIVFYSLLVFDQIDPVIIISAHLVLLCSLFLFVKLFAAKAMARFSCPLNEGLVVLAIMVLVLPLAIIMSLDHPWGHWDGWAYWNFHADFLFRAGHGWRRLFAFNIQAHHPWMLPLLVIWGWCFYGEAKQIVPLALGILFTVSTAGLLVALLKKYVPLWWAALAGIYLISVPYYAFHGVSQYADIEEAFFILLSLAQALELFQNPGFANAVLTGSCLGLTGCIKDNGIVAACLLMVMTIVRLRKAGAGACLKPLGWGFTAVGVSLMLMKTFDVFPSFNQTYAVYLPGIWDWHKWMVIGRHGYRSMMDMEWGGLWLLTAIVVAVRWVRFLKEETGFVAQFLVFFTIIYFFIFAGSALDIEWLLSTSHVLDHTIYLLAPAAVFVIFQAVGRKE